MLRQRDKSGGNFFSANPGEYIMPSQDSAPKIHMATD